MERRVCPMRGECAPRTGRPAGGNDMRKGKHALRAALGVVALAALTTAATAPARTSAPARADQGGVDLRRPAQRRRLVAGARRRAPLRPEGARLEGRDDLQGERPGGPAGLAGDRRASSATATRSSSPPRSASWTRWQRRRRSTRTSSSSMATGTRRAKNMAEYFGAGEDAIYLSGMAAGAATKKGVDRLRRPVPDPRGDPPRERVRARRAGDRTRGRR